MLAYFKYQQGSFKRIHFLFIEYFLCKGLTCLLITLGVFNAMQCNIMHLSFLRQNGYLNVYTYMQVIEDIYLISTKVLGLVVCY